MQIQEPKKNANFLLILAHPEKSSFSSSLRDEVLSVLQSSNHQILESDLYQMNFNPCISSKDFLHLPANASNPISLENEQKNSSELNSLSPDIVIELEKVFKSDVLIFIAPIFWGSLPAILKGWFDRVFVRGKTWDVNQWHENGLLKGRKALLVVSVAGKKEDFQVGGFQNNSIENILHHVTWCTLRFCGLEVMEPYVIYGVGVRPKEEIEIEISKLREYIQTLSLSF